MQAEARYVVRQGNRAAIDIEGGVRWERLTPETKAHLDFFELVYGPGAESNPTLYSHPGTEMVLMLTGRLDISVGFETYRLDPGDSMEFPSSLPHRYANPDHDEARAVTVIMYDCPARTDPCHRPYRYIASAGADRRPARWLVGRHLSSDDDAWRISR